MNDWLRRVRRGGVRMRLGVFGLCFVGFGAVVVPIAWFARGVEGVWAASAAWTLCGGGAALALVLSGWMQSPRGALWGLLAAMTARTGLPLLLGMAIYWRGGPLVDGGFVYYGAVFYPFALGVETALSLPGERSFEPARQGHPSRP